MLMNIETVEFEHEMTLEESGERKDIYRGKEFQWWAFWIGAGGRERLTWHTSLKLGCVVWICHIIEILYCDRCHFSLLTSWMKGNRIESSIRMTNVWICHIIGILYRGRYHFSFLTSSSWMNENRIDTQIHGSDWFFNPHDHAQTFHWKRTRRSSGTSGRLWNLHQARLAWG